MGQVLWYTVHILPPCRHVLGNSKLRGVGCNCAPSKEEAAKLHASGKYYHNSSYISSEGLIDHEAGTLCSRCQVTAFGDDSPIVCKVPFTKKQLLKPLFPLNKTVLSFQGRTRPSLCWSWLRCQPGGSQTCFLLLQQQVFFILFCYFLSDSCEIDKISSHQPLEKSLSVL